MQGSFWIFLELVSVALVSFLVSYCIHRTGKSKRPFVVPKSGAMLRLVIDRRIARARFESQIDSQWVLDCPVSKDDFPAIVAGSTVLGSFGSELGLVKFRSTVLRSNAVGKIHISAPHHTLVEERRQEPRISIRLPAVFEAVHSETLDLSPFGGRFSTSYKSVKGERVRIDLPSVPACLFGWVLEQGRNQIRVRFEEVVDLDHLVRAASEGA